MVTRSSKAAKAAFVVVAKQGATDVLSPEYNRADMVKRLVDANAKERLTLIRHSNRRGLCTQARLAA